MTGPLPTKAQEVADALAITFEREDSNGAPWCPPHDAAVLRRWIIERGRGLGGAIRRAVRFARLAAITDGRDYLRFIYVTVPTLRPRHFAYRIALAARNGQLSSSFAAVDSTSVVLRETEMKPQDGDPEDGFEIDFRQMPRLAALLDILHNTLGYCQVADIVGPLLERGTPQSHADEVARKLQAAFNAWLSERLESPHHIRQAQSIRAFLAARGRLTPDIVDDDAILAFWISVATAPVDDVVEGFRLFRSSARALLRYRTALQNATAMRALADPMRFGSSDDGSEVDPDRLAQAEVEAATWQSPLHALCSAPVNRVKWLSKKERLQLLNYLGGPHPAQDETGGLDDPIDTEAGEALEDPASRDTGLAETERFDLRFLRTLLRTDVFGAAQAAVVARLRKRVPADAAVAEAMSGIGEHAYTACAAAYAEVQDQLRLEMLACLHILVEATESEALVLMDRLGGSETVSAVMAMADRERAVRSSPEQSSAQQEDETSVRTIDAAPRYDDSDIDRSHIAMALREASARAGEIPTASARDLIAAAQRAARKVNREGFRPVDRAKPEILVALRVATAPVTDLLGEIERLVTALVPSCEAADVTADRKVFLSSFEAMYK